MLPLPVFPVEKSPEFFEPRCVTFGRPRVVLALQFHLAQRVFLKQERSLLQTRLDQAFYNPCFLVAPRNAGDDPRAGITEERFDVSHRIPPVKAEWRINSTR